MDQTNINWYIYNEEEYVQDNDYYLGSFTSSSTITLSIQVWNNRYGSMEIDTIENARLNLSFDSIEDAALFNYCTVTVNNSIKEMYIENGSAIIDIGILSGQANDGLENNLNKDNYKNIEIKFTNMPNNLKNGLKNLYLNIEDD